MKVRKSSLASLLFCCIFASCSEDEMMSNPFGELSGERICFGVSGNIDSWESDARALPQPHTTLLPCESTDKSFGVSLVVEEQSRTFTNVASRGTQVTETFDDFNVAAYYYAEGATDATLFFNEQVTDGVHTASQTYYWPREGTMDFMAIHPTGIATLPDASNYNSSASFTYAIPSEAENQKDILTAVSTGLDKSTGNPVFLTFKHRLASIQFKVGDMQFIKITKLSISGVQGGTVTFTYNKSTHTWSCEGTETSLTYSPTLIDTSGLPKGAEICGDENNTTLFLMPQTLAADAKINIEYTALLTGENGKGTAVIGGEGKTWEAGMNYAYVLNIGTTFNVTIPTPKDQDAHYIMLEMPYELGALSDYVSSIKATARFLDDGSNTSSKSGISLKFKGDLTPTQQQGFWTDKQYIETITVSSSGESSSSGVSEVGNIRGENELSISSLAGTIVLFIEENNGTTDRNGELTFTATLKNGSEIVIGQGNFKQLCPCWNDNGIGVERIEDAGYTHPYGFHYTRKVTYSNPGNNWTWLQIVGRVLYTWGARSVVSEDNIGFIDFDERDITFLGYKIGSWINSITLNYSALNEISSEAGSDDGLENTRKLYNITGSTNFSSIEETLNTELGWTTTETPSEDIPEDYAAFVALARNRMYELKTVTKANGQDDVTTYKAVLYQDNGNDVIEWYLPSSAEAKTLKETGTGSDVISPLDGTYWSSTAGDDANAYAHSYTFSNNVFGSINESEPRMNEHKVRAVRKKE